MRRRWPVLLLIGVGALALAVRPATTAPPTSVPETRMRARGHASPPASPRPPEVVADAAPVDDSWVASTVQDAMRQPGDSDRRLLDLLGTTGLRPGRLAPVGAALDPWLGLGLLDLDRQVSRRCARLTGDAGCWEPAEDAEDALRDVLDEGWLAALDDLRPQ
ncbi:MAG: hypothetical protein H6738_09500 [Alphaproteobacteria bacterium]|nr:hypothetical protein [Alphaproteobacteria bacterium]